MTYEPPLKITITTPDVIEQGFGPNSTGGKGGNLRVRCTNAEYDRIQEEAIRLGITLAMFCRWCSIQVAERLQEHREANSTDMSAGEEELDGSNPTR